MHVKFEGIGLRNLTDRGTGVGGEGGQDVGLYGAS